MVSRLIDVLVELARLAVKLTLLIATAFLIAFVWAALRIVECYRSRRKRSI
jgi:hypothetical protein